MQNVDMYFKKTLSILILVLSVFSSAVFAMTDDTSDIGEKSTKTRNKYGEDCLNSCKSEIKSNISPTRKDALDERTKHKVLYVGGCICAPINTPTGQGEIDGEISRWHLFSSSFLSGAAYTIFPEISRDILESRGYSSRASNIVAMMIQGGVILYSTSSYAPVVTGIAVRYVFSELGFSPQASAIAGSTTAIAASFIHQLIFSHETILDTAVDCTIAVIGSYAGSSLALKAKSKIYEIFGYGNPRACLQGC